MNIISFIPDKTNRSSYSRQVCAERIPVDENGTFLQAEMTSCGLNGGPLEGRGVYGARIACNLWSREGTGRYDCQRISKQRYKSHPYFTQEAKGMAEQDSILQICRTEAWQDLSISKNRQGM